MPAPKLYWQTPRLPKPRWSTPAYVPPSVPPLPAPPTAPSFAREVGRRMGEAAGWVTANAPYAPNPYGPANYWPQAAPPGGGTYYNPETGRWQEWKPAPQAQTPQKSASGGGGVAGAGGGGGGGGWGSFPSKEAWQQAFAAEHGGRAPTEQDERDFWASQEFAAMYGRAPTQAEWEHRYYTGYWFPWQVPQQQAGGGGGGGGSGGGGGYVPIQGGVPTVYRPVAWNMVRPQAGGAGQEYSWYPGGYVVGPTGQRPGGMIWPR